MQNLAGADPAVGGGLIGDVSDQLVAIMNTLSDLQLSWVGAAADEAQDFSDRWSAAMTDLFGTQADPSTGILVRLATGLGGATVNYTNAETQVVEMFHQFTVPASSSSGSQSTPPQPQSVVNTPGKADITAVIEQF